jgi:hypothetical protein
MSHEHEKPSPSDEPDASSIKLEPPPFEQGYQPESLPKITVPDLPEDAEGLSAEALSQVPTLTELVHDDTEVPEEINTEVASETAAADDSAEAGEHEATEDDIQEAPVQADTWTDVMHARMGKLTDEIHTLNARLDRLEEKIKFEV